MLAERNELHDIPASEPRWDAGASNLIWKDKITWKMPENDPNIRQWVSMYTMSIPSTLCHETNRIIIGKAPCHG